MQLAGLEARDTADLFAAANASRGGGVCATLAAPEPFVLSSFGILSSFDIRISSFLSNFTGVCGDLIVNSGMMRRALFLALGLFGLCFPVAAQQASRPGAAEGRAIKQMHSAGLFDAFELNFYRPKIFSAANSSLLFHKGPVRAWSDGGQLVSENALANIGMASLDLFPAAYLGRNTFEAAPARRASAVSDSRSQNFGTDGKDLSGMMVSSTDQFYYGGEVGILYGRWTGKGGGDLLQSYILGTVGNDKFQITVGTEYDESSGRTVRFRSFNGQR